jgi:hypothetical protein
MANVSRAELALGQTAHGDDTPACHQQVQKTSAGGDLVTRGRPVRVR